jgi:hypothetical protein
MVVNVGWHPESLPGVRRVDSVRQMGEICNINRPNPWNRFADIPSCASLQITPTWA